MGKRRTRDTPRKWSAGKRGVGVGVAHFLIHKPVAWTPPKDLIITWNTVNGRLRVDRQEAKVVDLS